MWGFRLKDCDTSLVYFIVLPSSTVTSHIPCKSGNWYGWDPNTTALLVLNDRNKIAALKKTLLETYDWLIG